MTPSHMRVQQQRTTSLSLSEDECHSFEMPQVLTQQALKGYRRNHSDWLNLCDT